ncbi:hypothetical protein KR084_012645 [Drosophila pseudotakahashii]|nr:hypothetical protein KR084_012645 [Drosophila pseudotakahashii]
MVRRRILTNSAKQASMNAYQQLWQQQELARGALVASMPEYWHSVCNRMGGAMPRMAVIAPPEVSSRKLSRLRRQLMKAPSETVPMHSFIPNYGLQQHPQVQFQRGYQSTGNRSCPSQSVSKAALLKPGCILAACQNQCFRNLPTAAGVAPTHPPQQHANFNQGNLFDYPGAVSPMQWQQQQYQVQQQHKQFLLQQQQKAVPVGILKNSSRVGVAQNFGGDYQTPKPKRVTIKSSAATRSGYQEPVVEQIKLKPAVPPKPSRRVKQNTLMKERQQLQQLQLQHELLKQHQSLQNQKDQEKLQLKKDLQQQQLLKHQKDLEKQQQYQKSQQQLDLCKRFNFGKFANYYIEGCNRDSDTETSMYKAANSEINPGKQQHLQQLKSSKSTTFSLKETNLQAKPEKAEVFNRESKTSSRRFLDRQAKKLESENDSSTITLTTEQNRSKTQYRSRTSVTDKATNTKLDSLDDFLKPGPQKAQSATSATSKGSRKLNINELLRNEKVKGLDGNPMWHSLMQLVAHMCEAKENDKGNKEQQSRLRAGSGTDGLQKQYSVYLMVTSDEEDEDRTSVKTKVEQSSSDPKLASHEGIHGEDQFAKRCDDVYQAEHPKLGRRRRSRRKLNPRLRDLSIPYPNSQTQLPMRRPLHWPKPDYSKSQSRLNRTRNPSRVRSRSSTKQAVKLRSRRSLSSALDEKRSWKLWQDLPMTARTLNKAYSRMLTLSGTN